MKHVFSTLHACSAALLENTMPEHESARVDFVQSIGYKTETRHFKALLTTIPIKCLSAKDLSLKGRQPTSLKSGLTHDILVLAMEKGTISFERLIML